MSCTRARHVCLLAAAAAAVSIASSSVRASQQPAFSTRIESVRVDVLVADNGRPILGLAPADFEILDNGVPQQVDLVSFENIPLNVVLALDMSDSVAGDRLEQLQDAGRAVLGGLTTGDQAAVVTFSHAVTRAAPLTGDIAIARAALDDAWGTGETSLADGVYAAMMIGEADAGRALVMVFSDGLDTSSWLTDDRVFDAAKRGDAVAYSVGVGDGGSSSFLRELASLTGGTAYKVDSTRDLRATFLRILEEFRHRYLVSYTPRGVSRDGWHKLDVRLKNRRATIKARPGYLAGGSGA
jgi:Ca-activated chloride channel homolog